MKGRAAKSLNNIIFGFISKLITTLFPFVIRSLFIKKIGVECLGLGNLCVSILGVLNLADLGFSGVIVYFMYEPVEKGDKSLLGALLNYFKKIYYVVGTVILFSGLVLMPFLRFFIHGEPPANINIYLIYTLYLLNSVVSYFVFAYKSSLLNVYQRLDIESKLASIVSIATYILEFCIVVFLGNYYFYVLVLPVSAICLNLIRSKIIDKLYPDIKCSGELVKEKRIDIRKKVISTFFFKIDSVVIKMADSIVISAFLGLVTLAKYNNYFLILTSIVGFLDVIQNSIRPAVGNSIVAETMEKNYEDMKFIMFIYAGILTVCGSCFLCLYQPFIKLWLGEEFLLPFSTVLLFIVYFYAWEFCIPVNIYKDAHGFWDKDRWRPLVEAPFNLILNIILVKTIGLNGVLISTIVTFLLITFPTVYYVMTKYYFEHKLFNITMKTMLYIFVAICINTLCWFCCNLITYEGILSFIIRMFIALILSSSLFVLLFCKTKQFKKINLYIKQVIK